MARASGRPVSPGEPRKAPAPRRGRPPGRPPAEGGGLRGRLLDAAVRCFSRQGIAATPLRAIADEAGVNAALLHYYFGDKPALHQAVLDERVVPAFRGLRIPPPVEDGDVGALVAAFVRGIEDIASRHPWLPALWVREVLCDGGALADQVFDPGSLQLPRLLVVRFTQAQARGELDPGLDPRLLVVSLVGLTLFPLAGAPTWRRMLDADATAFDGLGVHTLRLLQRGLAVG